MKILIIHFRVGKSDGVSIEISFWKEILESLGHEIDLCAGPVSIGADYVIPELEQQLDPTSFTIDEDAFGGLETYNSKTELNEAIRERQVRLEEQFDRVFSEAQPDRIIASNIFSVGEGLPAAGALFKSINKEQILTAAVHHDFYWENSRYKTPTSGLVKEQLERYFPPEASWLNHLCINSAAREELKKRKGIDSGLLHDTFNYAQPAWEKRPAVTGLLEKHGVDSDSLVVLQATRIVRRKNIELAIDFARELAGHSFPYKNRVMLLLCGYAEKRDEKYLERILEYAEKSGVDLVYTGRGIDRDYCLWDIYPYADIVTFPSQAEGFGNQLLEAFFAKKHVVVFEYPVFKKDIKPKGFEVVSLGNDLDLDPNSNLCKVPKAVLVSAGEQAKKILLDSAEYTRITDKNFKLAKRFFGYDKASAVLQEALNLQAGV